MRGPNHGINVETFLVQAFWIQAVHHESTPAQLAHVAERHRRAHTHIALSSSSLMFANSSTTWPVSLPFFRMESHAGCFPTEELDAAVHERFLNSGQ